MARSRPAAGEKPLHWAGSSKKDLLGFPGLVTRQIGIALGVVQRGDEDVRVEYDAHISA